MADLFYPPLLDTPDGKPRRNIGRIRYGKAFEGLMADCAGNMTLGNKKEGKDQYKRILAECFVNNLSLSSYLVRKGYAFAYRKYSKKFIDDENYARENNLGMWSMNFEYPWDYRKKN